MRLSLLAIAVLLAVPARSSAPGEPVWSTADDGKGQIRYASFEVKDRACAYSFIAEPANLERYIDFVEAATVHSRTSDFQNVTLTERFWPVGLVDSRYHRTIEPKAERVSWVLQEGRQRRHDGTWTVTPTPAGARIEFNNVIEAKSFLHQGVLEAIQRRAMATIVDAAIATCGSP